MSEEKEVLSAIEEQLEKLQEQIRVVAQQRADLLKAGETDGLDEFDQQLTDLRNQRQALLDKQLQLQRQPAGEDGGTEAGDTSVPPPAEVEPARPVVKGAQGKPPLGVRILTLLLVLGGVAAVTFGGIYYVMEHWIAPAPVLGVQGEDELDFDFSPLGIYLSANSDVIREPASDDPTPVYFRIESGETAVTIARRLEDEGLIADAEVFRRLLQYRGADQSIEAGLFELSGTMTMDEIIEIFREGRTAEVRFTIPEGWRSEQIAAFLEEQEVTTAEAYMELVRDPDHFDFDFLQDLPEGSTLEGYLFPDTYTILKNELTAERVIEMQLTNFEQRLTDELRTTLDTQEMTLHQAVTLASLVEREAVVADEREVIAGVYINRWQDGTLLNADPTIQYALGQDEENGGWWQQLSADDLKFDSPYNTYLYPGLPPGPIANPGLASVAATIAAPETEYYYFVSRNDGTHVFAKTLEEHIENVSKFQSDQPVDDPDSSGE